MSVSAAGPSANVANIQSSPAASTQRAADGDYKTAGQGRRTVKAADGDFKPMATAQTNSSSSVHAAVSSLKTGG